MSDSDTQKPKQPSTGILGQRVEVPDNKLELREIVSSKPDVVSHHRERLWILGCSLAFSFIAAVLPSTPENVRPAMLSIASSIVTVVVKPFDRKD
jgi:hypothetical protein